MIIQYENLKVKIKLQQTHKNSVDNCNNVSYYGNINTERCNKER
nr:MAG TPA: hypothetical protein [Caudoviricetes sp.]